MFHCSATQVCGEPLWNSFQRIPYHSEITRHLDTSLPRLFLNLSWNLNSYGNLHIPSFLVQSCTKLTGPPWMCQQHKPADACLDRHASEVSAMHRQSRQWMSTTPTSFLGLRPLESLGCHFSQCALPRVLLFPAQPGRLLWLGAFAPFVFQITTWGVLIVVIFKQHFTVEPWLAQGSLSMWFWLALTHGVLGVSASCIQSWDWRCILPGLKVKHLKICSSVELTEFVLSPLDLYLQNFPPFWTRVPTPLSSRSVLSHTMVLWLWSKGVLWVTSCVCSLVTAVS